MLKKVPAIFKNFYFLATCIFLVWMVFIADTDLITQIKMRMKYNGLVNDKEYYIEKIDEVKKERTELFSNDALLEKFAREKYFMKRNDEDIFIVEPTEE